MSDGEKKTDVEIAELLRVQRELVEAHIALVKMHQSLFSNALNALPSGAEARLLKTAQPSTLGEVSTERSGFLSESQPMNQGADGLKSHKANQAEAAVRSAAEALPSENVSTASILARFGGSVVLPLILGIMVVALLIRSPRELTELRSQLNSLRQQQFEAMSQSSDALKQAQSDLAATQEKLRQTQTALAGNEKALYEAQQALTHAGETTSAAENTASQVTAPSAPIAVVTPAEQLARSQRELRNARAALAANQRDLIKNQKAYRTVARVLAINRRSLDEARLKLRLAKGELTGEDVARQLKPWQAYLPADARPLMNDPRLEAGKPTAGDGGTEEEVPNTLSEVQALLVKTVTELRAVMTQLTDTQANITQAETDLTATGAEQRRVERQVLEIQQNPQPAKTMAEDADLAGRKKLPVDGPAAASAGSPVH